MIYSHHLIVVLITFFGLFGSTAWLSASACGCSKAKVKLSIGYVGFDTGSGHDDAVYVTFNGMRVYRESPAVEIEKNKNYSISVSLNQNIRLICDPRIFISFPYCSIQYSKNNGLNWTSGSNVILPVLHNSGDIKRSSPSSILIRITDPASDTANESVYPGSPANIENTSSEFNWNSQGQQMFTPSGVKIEIPMGSILSPAGYVSAGLLVNHSQLNTSAAAPVNFKLNMLSDIPESITEVAVASGQENMSEKHYIAPQGVFRVKGWRSDYQSVVNLENAQETLIEVYDISSYNATTQKFSVQPHSYYRIEKDDDGNYMPGIRFVQSNFGVKTVRRILASSNGYLSRNVLGNITTNTVVIPPAVNSSSWEKHITTTTDSVVTENVKERYDRQTYTYYGEQNYITDYRSIMISRTVDPSDVEGDELATWYSYYNDGQIRSVSNPDGSWVFYEYGADYRKTYTPWKSTASLLYNNGTWSLPSSGYAIHSEISEDKDGSTSYSKIVNLASGATEAELSNDYSSISSDEYLNYTTVTNNQVRRKVGFNSLMSYHTYTRSYHAEYSDKFLAGRTVMSWDSTGKATLYSYEKGNWNGAEFQVNALGVAIRTSATTGYIANPSSSSSTYDFVISPGHSKKEVTITAAYGVVREELWVTSASAAFELAKRIDYDYEPTGRRRQTGSKINGHYISKTEYVSPFITLNWDDAGLMTETETNVQGDIVRTSTSGGSGVPGSTTTYLRQGLTSTTFNNGKVISANTRDAAGRVVSSTSDIGAITTTSYSNGGRTVTRVAPGGVTTINSKHFDGQAISTTGTGVIPTFYSYAYNFDLEAQRNYMTTTTSIGTENSSRYSSVTNNLDGSTAEESFPNPMGGEPIVKKYMYVAGLSSPIRVQSTALNVPAHVRNTPMLSPAAAMGSYSLSGIESDNNGPVIASNDRLTETSTSYVQEGGVWFEETVVKSFHTEGTAASYANTTRHALAPVAISHQNYGTGLRWLSSRSNGITTTISTRDVFFTNATSVESSDDTSTTLSPDFKSVNKYGRTVSSYAYGQVDTENVLSNLTGPANPETMSYDSAGRVIRRTSPTGAVTTYGYNQVGQLEFTMDHTGKSTYYAYYPATHQNAGQLWKTTNPEGETVETLYNARGQVIETKGNGTYRVTYEYDSLYGDKIAMRTYRSSGNGDLTTWTYDPATGLLLAKSDAAGKTTTYTYDSAGRLATRTWARPSGVQTTYTYNAFGDLVSTTYSDATPSVTIVPDRLGRPTQITDASGTRTQTYHGVTGALDLVSYGAASQLPSVALDYTFDSTLRPAGYAVSVGNLASGPSSAVTYDDAGRLHTVTAAGATHSHTYRPLTAQLTQLTTTAGSATVQARALYYDLKERMIGTQTVNGTPTVLSRHGYTYDGAGRRVRATRENGQRWDYGYDDLGQVTAAVKKFPDTAPIPGHTFSFAYDGIGNRTSATLGGAGTAVIYTANSLNQYSSIQTEGSRYILGEAPATDAVTINGAPANRAGGLGFYWKQLTSSYRPNWNHDTVASNGTSIGGFTWTPAAEVVPTFDDDGNLTSDGRWTYSWDAENRLVQMQSTAAAIYVGVPNQRLTFAYDSQSRRIAKMVASSTDGQTWTVQHESRYLYDGWNLIAEYRFHSSNLTLHSSYSWGNDLSGTPQGAGGVGGLLSVTLHDGSSSTNVYPSYDGNGNISAWSNATGALLARMDYSPFGQLLTQHKFTPPGDTTLARLQFGFSTKYTDAESGLLYYGYRFYDPMAGRWINRDPIEERGGLNLYGMVGNAATVFYDVLGTAEYWVGYHYVMFGDSHSKIWVITSDLSEINARNDWKELNENRVPKDSNVDKKCAKFITIGAGPANLATDELEGALNRESDVAKDLGGAVLLGMREVGIIAHVEAANTVMNGNFRKTTLEYDIWPDGWNWHGWDEFNSNSYIAGIQGVIGFLFERPNGGSLPGFDKPVPGFLFKESFSDSDIIKDRIYQLHPW